MKRIVMLSFEILPSLVGYILCTLAIVHALLDSKDNRIQRLLMLFILFIYGTFLEFMGVTNGHYHYATDFLMILEVVPLPVSLAWVGIIYSVMIIAERLELKTWQRIIATSLIALSLDWGMDPVAVELGLWTWETDRGEYFGVPGFNFFGWFFIPIAFLIAYGLGWEQENKRFKLYTIHEIDEIHSLSRKLYTLLLVIPISIGILVIVGIISLNPFIYYMPFIGLVIWAILTVLIATFLILWKHNSLKREKAFDLIPPCVLLYIGFNYALYGFLIGRFDLGFLMLLAGIPLWLVFIFTFIKR